MRRLARRRKERSLGSCGVDATASTWIGHASSPNELVTTSSPLSVDGSAGCRQREKIAWRVVNPTCPTGALAPRVPTVTR